jgi:hypothetical protein
MIDTPALGRQLAVVADYAGLLAALRARAEQLDVSRRALDELGGLADGHTAALLSGFAGLGPTSFGLLLGALAVRLAVIEDAEATLRLRRRRAINGGQTAHTSHWMQATKTTVRWSFLTDPTSQRVKGKRRMALLTKHERSALAGRAARIRWARQRKERDRVHQPEHQATVSH